MDNITCRLDNCERPRYHHSTLCGGHRSQAQRKQEFRPVVDVLPNPADRFWLKVNKTADCWLWTAAMTSTGYGLFALQDPATKKSTMHKAHRMAYTLEVGPIPDGHHLDHTCHVALCVNPAHLRPATNKQNLENRAGANMNSKTGVRGVHWSPRIHRYIAQVKHNGVHVLQANFLTLEEAEAAAVKARNEHFTHNHLDRIA